MNSSRSLVSLFDELWQRTDTSSQICFDEFLRFVSSQEECRLKWLETEKENQRLKKLLDESKTEIIKLENHLDTARKILDQERLRKKRVDEERNRAELQLQMVRDLLFGDNRNHIHDETKEKLKFLNSTTRSRISNDYNDRLSAIRELDSTGSFLSDLSFSRSDDDLDLNAVYSKKRTYKKHRPSTDTDRPHSVKRRRSSQIIELNNEHCIGDRMIATTVVTVENNGSMSAHSQIEAVPTASNPVEPPPLIRYDSLDSVESGLSLEKNTGYNQGAPGDIGVLPIGSNKIIIRNHTFTTKTVIRPEHCDVCEKRIKFGNAVIRCQNCRASCHTMCKDNLPLPCIGPGNTPISKNTMGTVADYAPSMPPMIPALVVHCIKEIENRGLNEHGIYRVPGSDKEVRALKERFMKCKGVPRLVDLDIHVICGCLKDFLRKLKEPLVTHTLWWEFVQAAELYDLEERRARLYQAISQLPQPNKDTLAFVILHLLRVAETKETNKMTAKNLATVFGPTIVGHPSDNLADIFSQISKAKLVVEQFLNIPADYWLRVMSEPSNIYSTPRTTDKPQCPRTPSVKNFKKLFDTPSY